MSFFTNPNQILVPGQFDCDNLRCWCYNQGADLQRPFISAIAIITLHRDRLAEDELHGGSTKGSRTALHSFFDAAWSEKEKGVRCKNGLYTVQVLLVQWLYYFPGEGAQVQRVYDNLGGMTAIGLSFDIIQDNARQGFRVTEGKTGTWLTTPSTDGPGIRDQESFGDFSVIYLRGE